MDQEHKKDMRRHINDVMLGESDAAVGTTLAVKSAKGGVTPVVATGPVGTNAAQVFLDQRPEPKPVLEPAPHKSKLSNMELRDMHRAGGYDYANYYKRNWDEILTQLHINRDSR